MKRLGEILSNNGSVASSEDRSAAGPPLAEAGDSDCPICGGAGFVRVERPIDDPRFGRAEPCSCVLDEDDDARRARLERLSNLGSLTRFTFDTLARGGRDASDDAFTMAYDAALTFAAEPTGWLVFTGPSGSGKTHLAAAIANQRIARGHPALFVVVPDMLDRLRAGYSSDDPDESFDALFEQVREAPLLILDDIDAAAPTDWAKEKLFQVVNHRFNAGMATVFTTSTRPGALDDRLATRLCDAALSRVLPLSPGSGANPYEQVGGMTRERLAAMNFGNFHVSSPGYATEENDSLQAAFRLAMDFADEPSGWLTLQGTNGCGKTHLAAAIANRVLNAGGGVFFAVVPDLLDHLRASFAPGREADYDETFERIRTTPLLILDDLGAQHTSPWAQEKLYQIVNYRTVAGLPGVVTTDRSLDELLAAHPRIAARLADSKAGTLIQVLAPHFRMGRPASRNEPPPPRRTRR